MQPTAKGWPPKPAPKARGDAGIRLVAPKQQPWQRPPALPMPAGRSTPPFRVREATPAVPSVDSWSDEAWAEWGASEGVDGHESPAVPWQGEVPQHPSQVPGTSPADARFPLGGPPMKGLPPKAPSTVALPADGARPPSKAPPPQDPSLSDALAQAISALKERNRLARESSQIESSSVLAEAPVEAHDEASTEPLAGTELFSPAPELPAFDRGADPTTCMQAPAFASSALQTARSAMAPWLPKPSANSSEESWTAMTGAVHYSSVAPQTLSGQGQHEVSMLDDWPEDGQDLHPEELPAQGLAGQWQDNWPSHDEQPEHFVFPERTLRVDEEGADEQHESWDHPGSSNSASTLDVPRPFVVGSQLQARGIPNVQESNWIEEKQIWEDAEECDWQDTYIPPQEQRPLPKIVTEARAYVPPAFNMIGKGPAWERPPAKWIPGNAVPGKAVISKGLPGKVTFDQGGFDGGVFGKGKRDRGALDQGGDVKDTLGKGILGKGCVGKGAFFKGQPINVLGARPPVMGIRPRIVTGSLLAQAAVPNEMGGELQTWPHAPFPPVSLSQPPPPRGPHPLLLGRLEKLRPPQPPPPETPPPLRGLPTGLFSTGADRADQTTAIVAVEAAATKFPLEGTSGLTCKYARLCRNTHCPDVHPAGRAIAEDPTGSLCRFGLKCKRSGCFFLHPAGREIDSDPTKGFCKFGTKCQRRDCLYTHPEGRELNVETRRCNKCGNDGHLMRDCPLLEHNRNAVPDPGTIGQYVVATNFPAEWSNPDPNRLAELVAAELEVFGALSAAPSVEGQRVIAAFADPELARAAVESLHCNVFELALSETPASVILAHSQARRNFVQGRTASGNLVIKGFPQSWDSTDLVTFLRGLVKPAVFGADIFAEPDSGMNAARVRFADVPSAQSAADELRGQKIAGKPLSVDVNAPEPAPLQPTVQAKQELVERARAAFAQAAGLPMPPLAIKIEEAPLAIKMEEAPLAIKMEAASESAPDSPSRQLNSSTFAVTSKAGSKAIAKVNGDSPGMLAIAAKAEADEDVPTQEADVGLADVADAADNEVPVESLSKSRSPSRKSPAIDAFPEDVVASAVAKIELPAASQTQPAGLDTADAVDGSKADLQKSPRCPSVSSGPRDEDTKTWTIYVDELAMPKRPKVEPAPTDREVFVDKLPQDEKLLDSKFQDFGKPEDVFRLPLPEDDDSVVVSRPGYVCFADHAAAAKCVAANCGTWSESERAIASHSVSSASGCQSAYKSSIIGQLLDCDGLEKLQEDCGVKQLHLEGDFSHDPDPVDSVVSKRVHFLIKVSVTDEDVLARTKAVLERRLAEIHDGLLTGQAPLAIKMEAASESAPLATKREGSSHSRSRSRSLIERKTVERKSSSRKRHKSRSSSHSRSRSRSLSERKTVERKSSSRKRHKSDHIAGTGSTASGAISSDGGVLAARPPPWAAPPPGSWSQPDRRGGVAPWGMPPVWGGPPLPAAPPGWAAPPPGFHGYPPGSAWGPPPPWGPPSHEAPVPRGPEVLGAGWTAGAPGPTAPPGDLSAGPPPAGDSPRKRRQQSPASSASSSTTDLPPAPEPSGATEAPPGALQHPPGVLDVPSLQGEDGDFLSTLPRLHLKVEQDLADAVLDFLKSWADKHPEGKHPNLVHLGADPRVRQCKASVLPREVALRLWIERRFFLGCAASAGSRLAKLGVEVGRDERGMNVVRLSGNVSTVPPASSQVAPSQQPSSVASQPAVKNRRHGFAAKSAAPQPPVLVGKAAPPRASRPVKVAPPVDATGLSSDPISDVQWTGQPEEALNKDNLDDSFDEDPFGDNNPANGRPAALHSRDGQALAEVAPPKRRKVKRRRRELPAEEPLLPEEKHHELQIDPRRTARGAADGSDDDVGVLPPPPEQPALREGGERPRRRERQDPERPEASQERREPERPRRRERRDPERPRRRERRDQDAARRPVHMDPRASLSAAELPRANPGSRSPLPGTGGLTLVPRRAVELRSGS